MSSVKNVPVIAITPDEGPKNDFDNYQNYDEVLTDVEDIYFQTEKRKKKTRKVLPKKNAHLTDVEDFEGSDDDISSPIVKHCNPILLHDLIETDNPSIEEVCSTGEKRGKNKLQSQLSITNANTEYLHLNNMESEQVLTDLEDFDTSDEEDERSTIEIADTDLLREIIHDSGTVAISDTVKKFLQAVPSPIATPIEGASDSEQDSRKINLKQSKSKKNRNQHMVLSISPQLSDLTDTEFLHLDDTIREVKKKYKDRRYTLPRKIKLDTTDSEDLEVTDNEHIQNRRKIVTNLSKTTFQKLDSEYSTNLKFCSTQSSNSFPVSQIISIQDSDDEDLSVKISKLITKNDSKHCLKIDNFSPGNVTDVEEIEGDEVSVENYYQDESKHANCLNEYELHSGIIEDKNFTKKSNYVCKIEESCILRKNDNKNIDTQSETDEEECDFDVREEQNLHEKLKDETLKIKFVRNENKEKNTQINTNKNSQYALNLPNKQTDLVYTDVENIDSSSSDEDDKNLIPVTVFESDLFNQHTDIESVEGDSETEILGDISEAYMPICSRKILYEKVDHNNKINIVSIPLGKSDSSSNMNDMNNETDLDDLSGDDLNDTGIEMFGIPNSDFADANDITSKESLKISKREQMEDVETDVEDINTITKPASYTNKTEFLQVVHDEVDKYTDTEDLELSETENVSQYLSVAPNTVSNNATDVESLEGTDNEEDRIEIKYSKTPDILRQMSCETICTQEGIGNFSNEDRNKLNEKHKIINFTASPSPTFTDETVTSADDENCMRAETATPLQMRDDLDETSCKIHSQNIRKIDLDAEEEVMYLKGGGFLPETYTDVDEIGISDEEYFLANEVNDEALVNNKLYCQINHTQNKTEKGIVSELSSFNSCISTILYSLEVLIHSKNIQIDKIKLCKQKPVSFTLETNNSMLGYKTEIFVSNLLPLFTTTMFHCNYLKTIELKYESTLYSKIEIGDINTDFITRNKQSNLINSKIPYIIRLRSGSVTKLITHYENCPQFLRKYSLNEIKVPREIKEHIQENVIQNKKHCVNMCTDQPKNNIRRNTVIEKAKHFEMLTKSTTGKNLRQDAKQILTNKEWGLSKGTPSEKEKLQQPDPAEADAALQDSGAVLKDSFAGNQKVLKTSYSKLNPYPNPDSKDLKVEFSSYTQLDKILDNMLAEVDKQEMLVQLDNSQKLLKPVCVNSLKLLPATEALIEIPVGPVLYETKHEIIVQERNSDIDLCDESQDTDSLRSFESISEIFFLDNVSHNYKASAESLNDYVLNFPIHSSDDDHLYEIVEPKENVTFINKSESCDNQQNIWWEGIYRDLSIVPEEDEDNVSESSEHKNHYKYLKYCTPDIPKLSANSRQSTMKYLNEISDDNSSSDISLTTGDECDTSDMEHNPPIMPVKAEIKLLVKTLDNGKEDIEIRTIREFSKQVKNENAENKMSQPSFVLQRLLVKCPDNSRHIFNPLSKNLSKSYPELIAASSNKYPLEYDQNIASSSHANYTKNSNNIDLYANTPFYPCYGTYMEKQNENLLSSNPSHFPTAYCDWFLQPDDPNGGITTSPPKHLVSSEVYESKFASDNLSKDVIDETKHFIRVESQSEDPSVCTFSDINDPNQLKSSELSDKANKDLDNKKEKSKSNKGFFSSLKSLVSRSTDNSDSESKEEKTPKKKKKEKSTPKKGKKGKGIQNEEQITLKPKHPSPEAEKKIKALYESNDIANIPSIDEVDLNDVQITDLDAEPVSSDELKIKATAIINDVIIDSQQVASKLLNDKMQEFNLEGTVTPEEVRKSTEPIIINEDEFLVVIEPQYRVKSTDENIQHSKKKHGSKQLTYEEVSSEKLPEKLNEEGKTDTLKSKKSVGFLKLFSKKDSKESDDESHVEEQKQNVGNEENRKSVGFFGLFSKKSKDDELVIEESNIEHTKDIEGKKFSEEVQKEIVDTSHNLLKEIKLSDDVKPQKEKSPDILPQENPSIVTISDEVQQHIIDSDHFLMKEKELFEDVKLQQIVEEKPFIKEEIINLETPTKVETVQLVLSDEVQQQMVDSAHFLLREVELYEDAKPAHIIVTNIETSDLKRTAISEEVQQQIINTANFLYTEVEMFDDVKPRVESVTKNKIDELQPDNEINLQNEDKTETLKEEIRKHEQPIDMPSEMKSQDSFVKQENEPDFKPGFFSKLGEKFGGKSVEKKEEVKEKKPKKKKEKKPGFFSKIGEKFSGTLSDEEKEKSAIGGKVSTNIEKEIMSTDKKISEKISDTVQKSEIIVDDIKKSEKLLTDVETDAKNLSKSEKDKVLITNIVEIETEPIKGLSETYDESFSHISQKIEDSTKQKQDELKKVKDHEAGVINETITDIKDTAKSTTEEFGKTITETVENTKKSVSNIKDAGSEKLKTVSDDTKKFTESTKDAGSQKVDDAVKTGKESIEEFSEKSSGFFSGIGKKIKGTSKHTEAELKKVKDHEAKVIGETVTDMKDSFKSTTAELSTTVEDAAEPSKKIVSDVKDAGSEKLKTISDETKELVKSAKDTGSQKVDDAVKTGKESIEEFSEKSSGFFSGIGKKIKGTAKHTEAELKKVKDHEAKVIGETVTDMNDSFKSTTEELSTTVEGAAENSKKIVSDVKDAGSEKLKTISDETKELVESAKDTGNQKVDDAVKTGKESIEEFSEKSSGFFSGIGKKIKGTAKHTEAELKKVKDHEAKVIGETVTDMKDSLKSTTEELSTTVEDAAENSKKIVSDVKDAGSEKLKTISDETKELVESAKDTGSQKVSDVVDTGKEITEEISDKSSGFFSGIGKKIKGTAKHTEDEFKKVKVHEVKKIEETVTDMKDSVILTTNDFSKTVKDTAENTKQITSDAKDTGLEKLKTVSDDTKKIIKNVKDAGSKKVNDTVEAGNESVEEFSEKSSGFFSGIGKKIKSSAKNTEDELKKEKDHKSKVIEETVIDTKDAIKSANEKLCETVKDTVESTEKIASDIKDAGTENLKTVVDNTKKLIENSGEAEFQKINDAVVTEKEFTEEISEKSSGFFSGIGKKIKGTAKHTEDELKKVKEHETKVIGETVTDIKDSVKSTANDFDKTIKETAENTKKLASNVKEAGSEKLKTISDDTKNLIENAKDAGTQKANDTVQKGKESIDEISEKSSGFFSGIGKKIKGTAKHTEDKLKKVQEHESKVIEETVIDMKDAVKSTTEGFDKSVKETVDSTKKVASDVEKAGSDKLKTVSEDTKKFIEDAKDTGSQKVSDVVETGKDSVEEFTEKSSEFFSGIGKKIKGTAKHTEDELKKVKDHETEIIGEAVIDMKDSLKSVSDDFDKTTKETAEKVKKTVSVVEDVGTEKLKTISDDTKNLFESVKNDGSQKLTDVVETGKESIGEISEKSSGFFSGIGKKIKGTAKHTEDELKKVKDHESEIIGETVTDMKTALKSTTEEFSKSIKESAEKTSKIAADVKEAGSEKNKTVSDDANKLIDSAKDVSSQKMSDVAETGKESIEELSKKSTGFFSGFGKKIKSTAKHSNDELKKVKDHEVKVIGETVTDIKNAAKSKTDELGTTIKETVENVKESGSDKLKTISKDTKQIIEDVKDTGSKKVSDVVETGQESVEECVEKTSGFFSGIGKKIKGSAKHTEDKLKKGKDHEAKLIGEKVTDLKDSLKSTVDDFDKTIKETAESTKKLASDAKEAGSEKIKTISDDTKSFIENAKDAGSQKADDAVKTGKESIKEISDKSSGFFSGIGKKIKGTAKHTEDELQRVQVPESKVIEEKVIDMNDAVKSTTEEFGKSIKDTVDNTKQIASDIKEVGLDKLKTVSDETKSLTKSVKDTASQKVSNVVEIGKDFTEEISEESSGFLSGIGKKIKDSGKSTTEELDTTIKKTAESAKEITSDVKETGLDQLKTVSEKTKKFIEDGKDAGSRKINDAVETGKELTEKSGVFFSGIGMKIKGTAKHVEDDSKKVKDHETGLIGQTVTDIKDTVKSTTEEIGKTIKSSVENTEQIASDTKDACSEKFKTVSKDTKKVIENVKDAGSQKVSDAVETGQESIEGFSEKSSGFFSGIGKKIKGTVKHSEDELKQDIQKETEKISDTISHAQLSADKVCDTVKDSSNDIKTTTSNLLEDMKTNAQTKISIGKENMKSISEDVRDKFKDTVSEIEALTTDIDTNNSEGRFEILKQLNSTQESAAKKTKDILDEGNKVTESFKKDELKNEKTKADNFFCEIGEKIKHKTQDTQQNIISTKDYVSDQAKESIHEVKQASKDCLEKCAGTLNDVGQDIKKVTKNISSTREKKSSKLTGDSSVTDGNQSAADFICYVTTPNMKRKGIGGSQRYTKDERPAPIDVSNMPVDISSDEEEYIVTEPVEKYGKHVINIDSSDSSCIIENIAEHEDIQDEGNKLIPDENKRRPLFHIGSKDEESIELGDKKSIHSDETKTKCDTNVVQIDAQKDIDLIENKLFELDKALNDLEKINLDLEPQESNTDEKNERKLRRVERRFERMASETMEKDIEEAKAKQLSSPEIEAERENEFRTMVSQLSQEEVSECQKLYSTLWDDATFTPSEEWDSKTPDSQPDDIQDLPQGEVVYMGPVTLNKDNLVNKAGIEVDVIPIKRSPCTSPLPKKKLESKRARSAMGFYKEKKQVEERGSLPDLQNTGKNDYVQSDIQKGSILSAILKVRPNILRESFSNNSNSSLYSDAFNKTNFYDRRKSTDSLTKGTVVNAVKEWMEKSTPFGSTDNVRSTDAISLAETTISIFDDDDYDSVDMYSDSVCQFESECSKSDNQIPDIHIYSDNNIEKFHNLQTKVCTNHDDVIISAAAQVKEVISTLDQFSLGETSGGPLTNITTEGSTLLTTNLNKQDKSKTHIPKPKPRIDKTPDTNKIITSQLDNEQLSSQEVIEKSDVITEDVAYLDKKKFWENVSASKKDEDRSEIPVKKRMSLYEEQLLKSAASENITTKKRISVHDIGQVPPVPKPRSTVLPQEQAQLPDKIHEESKLKETKAAFTEESHVLVSEYRAAFKDPNLVSEETIKLDSTETKLKSEDTVSSKTEKHEKSVSIDSENEYSKFEHQAYENAGYLSDDQEVEQKSVENIDIVPQIKRRQMSISQPPIAAARKTIFERSASLPTSDLKDVNEASVKARKQYFEQQIRNEMVIDQLMTQLEEEELQEYKTLTSTEELSKVAVPEDKIKKQTIMSVTEKDADNTNKDIDKKLSPISSSSSQDTKTEDDITQYTPTSVKDLSKYFQPALISDVTVSTKFMKDVETEHVSIEEKLKPEVSLLKEDVLDKEICREERETHVHLKQSSTESEQSISSERSIELGSADELPSQLAEILQYKSDSISKPSDSLEVHVDKSEIEDSEKGTDIEQDGTSTDVEIKSLSTEEYLLDSIEEKICEKSIDYNKDTKLEEEKQHISEIVDIKQHTEELHDTVWEVSVESQPAIEIVESVTEIPIERQVIIEKDEELSGSARDESDLGSEIHQDHSESYDSEKVQSESRSEVEQLILESLYHQKVHPEEAKKIAAELIDDIEAEIERRNLLSADENEENEPPVPNPEVAKNQISEYLRQLAESKGLDAKEVQLVESVLARKQNELSKLGRHDTQTSSMEITDEDLRYSGADNDMSPSESHQNILDEQIEHLEHETNVTEFQDKKGASEEKFSEKTSNVKSQDIHAQQDREIHADNTIFSIKTETSGKVDTTIQDETSLIKTSEEVTDNDQTTSKHIEENIMKKQDKEEIKLDTDIEIKSDISVHVGKISTSVIDDQKQEHTGKHISVKKVTDNSEIEETVDEDITKKIVSLEGIKKVEDSTHEKIDGGFVDTKNIGKTEVYGSKDDQTENKLEHKQQTTILDDGTQITSEEIKEEVHSKSFTTSHIVDHKREETTTVTTFVNEMKDESLAPFYSEVRQIQSDESKSSPCEFVKSSVDQTSSSSSIKKDDSDTSQIFDKCDVIMRKSKLYKDVDTSSSSGNLKTDRKSGTDFEVYSSSGESHYHSFEQDSGKSRPCSSDVEGLLAAGSSEYESALTSQDISSRSHITSAEYHTAVSSLSSRESMKSLDSESSGHLASMEVSEASETLVPSTCDEGDIIDGAVSQLLEDEMVDSSDLIEPYDREIPEHVIRGDYPMKDKKSSFDTISDSDIHGESMDMSEEDSTQEKPAITGEVTSKMKRSQEMTFQPIPKAIIPDSPQSENALEIDDRFGSSLEDGSVLSVSLSSTSDASALRTVIESSRRGSDKMESSFTTSEQDSISASNVSLDKIQSPYSSAVDSSTSTMSQGHETLSSVTLTTSTIDENGTQSVCTQVTSQSEIVNKEVYNGPTQVDYTPEYDDVIETKKVRGHRRQESTSTFVPSMIPGFTTRTEKFKSSESDLTLKEVHHEEMKDVDETEANQGKEKEYEITDTDKSGDISDTDVIISHKFTEQPVISEIVEKKEIYEKQIKISLSEKSSIEEGEAEAAFSMVAHISPAHKAKGDICPILEDEDAEKHELETRERAQKELEKRRAQIIKEQSPGSIPDIMVTEHMTPLIDREFHYPDLELEEKEAMIQKSAPQTPASMSSKSSEDTDQGREYVLDDNNQVIPEEPELESIVEDKCVTEVKSDKSHSAIEGKIVYEATSQEPASAADSPNSDSFEMLEKPDIIDDFVVIEEVAKEAAEHDSEGKSVEIAQTKYIRKHDEEVEEYLVKSAPTPLTRMTDLKYYPDGGATDEIGPFDFEDSPPQAAKKSTGMKTSDVQSSRSYGFEYDKELEASKKWIEMQFQGDQAAIINAGYGYEMEFERGPLEDIKEEEATDFESSRIGSLDSQKHSVGSLGSVKDSFSSTPEYDVLAGRKFFTRSGEHDDVSMSSLQEFEQLERVISLENRRHHQGSQDSSSNGSFSKRYHASRSGQGDDISLSSLKEFEGLETACIEAHKIEIKAKEEEALLAQIDEAQENLISESESCKSISSTDKKNLLESEEEEDYEKRMFEIDEIIKQAQSNVEKFIDIKDIVDKTESMGRGDSLEEVARVPDLELDEPLLKSSGHSVKWETADIMQTSTDSLELKPSHHDSTDSLDAKTGAVDIMTTSTDSIEYQLQAKSERGMVASDSIEMQDPDKSCMITSDSLELTPGALANAAQISDSIDEDGSRIGEPIAHDQSSSSGFSIGKDELAENIEIQDQRAEFLLGSTDSLDPSSSTATHATYQYETDSVMSGSFASGGSNTMVSSTDTIDPLYSQAHGVDIATAVRKVWFDDDSFGAGAHFTTELLDDGSKPFVTEVIEPCEGDPEYSHTIHRKVELPPEIKKITFKGPNADLQLRQYIENFGEGEDVQESQEIDKDGNVHVKRVVQKRFIVKSDPSGEEKRISGPELEAYLQQVSQSGDEFNLKDPTDFGLTKQTRTDSDGTKTIYGQKFTAKYVEGEESSLKQLLSSIASDVTECSSYSEHKLTHRVDNQQEQPIASSTSTFSGAAAANALKAQGSRRKPLRFDISVDDQTEVDPREHDWRFILPQHDERTPDEKPDTFDSKQEALLQRDVSDQHQLSSEMKELLEEMEKQSKQ